MRITPMDIRQQQFRVRFRGFDRQEVDAFLADVAEDYEQLVKENALLKEQLAALEERSRGIEQREKLLQDTLLTTQRLAEEMKDGAKREANLLVREAELQGDKLLEEARAEEAKIKAEILALKRTRRQLAEGLRVTLDMYQRLVTEEFGDAGSGPR
ncbi:MAG: DivIVA domain-containing protein [Candidatus Rokubacteria bacterium]|nr:DivIVA domain-containing protein [Candidatus Rokubacteria bacterium]MBI2544141.1 DivIVA domain-containing protein [Candidatus Rokubacteria bacterium]MBI2552867.1 DivIVA domain-containing protein [Candidatus Rokubacteria bacterium]